MKSISIFLLFFGCVTCLSNCFNNNLTIEQEVRKTALEASDSIIWSNPDQSTIEDRSTLGKYHYLIADNFTVKLDIPQDFIKSVKTHKEITALISSLIEIQCLNIIDVLQSNQMPKNEHFKSYLISKAEERYNKEGLTIPDEWNVQNICRIFLTEEILKKYLTEWLYKDLTEQQSRHPKPLITFTTQKNKNKSPSLNKTELIKSLIEYYQVEEYNMVPRDDETEVFLILPKKTEYKISIHIVNVDYLPNNDDLRRAKKYFTPIKALPEGIQYFPIAELNNLGFPHIFGFTTVEEALFTQADITDIQIHESNSNPQQIVIALELTKKAQEKLNQIVDNHEHKHIVLAINQLIYFSSPIYKNFQYRLFFPSDTTLEFTNDLIQMIKTN